MCLFRNSPIVSKKSNQAKWNRKKESFRVEGKLGLKLIQKKNLNNDNCQYDMGLFHPP